MNKVYDWKAVQQFRDLGHSFKECKKKFGFASQSWSAAIKRGDLISRPAVNLVKSDVMLTENSRYPRVSVRRRVLKDKLLPYVCQLCHAEPLWQSKPLALVLDHINGVFNDHRLSNLRFLCPNCNAQLPTFSGRNRPYKQIAS